MFSIKILAISYRTLRLCTLMRSYWIYLPLSYQIKRFISTPKPLLRSGFHVLSRRCFAPPCLVPRRFRHHLHHPSSSSQGAPSSSASSHVTKNVSSIPVGDGIDIQLSSDLRHIKFYSENSDVMAEVGRTHFEVKCKKRAFKLNLMHNKNLLTVYQSLSLSDGIVKARKRKKPQPVIALRKCRKATRTCNN